MKNNHADLISNSRPDFLRNFALLFFKRKRIILATFFFVVGTVTIGSFLMTPIYESTAKIVIDRDNQPEKALLFGMNLPTSFETYDWMKSEIEIINSYPVAERVVKELGLHKIEFDDEIIVEKEPDLLKKAIIKFQATLEIEKAGNSNILRIRFEAKDATLVANITNKIIQTYLTYRSEMYDESETYRFFEQQLKIADENLRELEQRQATYKHSEEMVSADTQVQILLTKLADFEKSLTSVRMKRIGKKAKLAVIEEQLNSHAQYISIPATDVSDSPSREKFIAKLKGELLDMEIARDQLLQRFKPTYKAVIELNRNIDTTKEKIRGEILQIVQEEKTAVKALLAEEKALRESIVDIRLEVKDFAQKEYDLSQISRGIDDNREVYSMLLKQREEARISLAKFQRDVKIKVVSPAVPPNDPIKPRKLLNLILAIFFGLLGGFAVAYFVEANDHSVSSPEDLEKLLGISTVGSLREIEK